MTTKKECLIYMRTSTLTNVKGDSFKRQKSSIMKWVKSNGYSVRGEYWDVESGSKDTMDRPEFMRMITDSERLGSALDQMGLSPTKSKEEADVVVLNTCVVRQNAENKAVGTVTSLKPQKEANPCLLYTSDAADE